MSAPIVEKICVYHLEIPLADKTSSLGGKTGITEQVIVGVDFRDGTKGFGEAIPRRSYTKETCDSIVAALSQDGPARSALASFHPTSFPDALEAIEKIPHLDAQDNPMPATRCAIELCLLDATLRFFERSMDEVVSWMGLPGFGSPGSANKIRYSMVIATHDQHETSEQVRSMRLEKVKDFKLKSDGARDQNRDWWVVNDLSNPMKKGKASLRIDAGGTWALRDVIEWLERVPIARSVLSAFEQPVRPGMEEQIVELKKHCKIPLICDESADSEETVRSLIEAGGFDGFNITIGRYGGLIPSLRCAGLAKRAKKHIQLGSIMGESSILGAAGVRFLQMVPGVSWAEGCLGTHLLGGDVTDKPVTFRSGGKPPLLTDEGLGVTVDEDRLRALCAREPIVVQL